MNKEELEQKIREIFSKKNSSEIKLFEVEGGNYKIDFDNESINFDKLQVYERTPKQLNEGQPVATFLITGGKNGSGEWQNYLNDLEKIFKELKNKLGRMPVLYQLETDLPDDVWIGYVFLYDNSEHDIDDSIKLFKDSMKIHDDLFDKVLNLVKEGKVGDDELLLITGDEYDLGQARFDMKHNPAKIARRLIEEEVFTSKHFEDVDKPYLKITIFEDGSYDVQELTAKQYEKLFDRYNSYVETIHGLGNGQCWMQLAHSKVILCKKESLNTMKNKFNLKDSKISDIIKKTSKGYEIYSHKGKRLSKAFKTRKEAEERLKEIEMFKHMNDTDEFDGYEIVNEKGHYAIYKNGKFVSSADNLSEAKEDIRMMNQKPEIKSDNKMKKYMMWYTNSIDQGSYIIVEAPSLEEAVKKGKKELGRELRSNFRDITILDSRKKVEDMEKRFDCKAYYSSNMKGLADEFLSNDLSDVKAWVWEQGFKGYAIRVIDNYTGEVWNFEEIEDESDLNIIDPAEIDWDDFEESEPDEDSVHLWILSWFNKNGNKFTAEFDSKEDAEAYITNHQDEDHNDFRMREEDRPMMDCLHIPTKDAKPKVNEDHIKTYMQMKAEIDYNNGEFSLDKCNEWINKVIMYDIVNWFNRQPTEEEKAFIREYGKYICNEYMPGYINAEEPEEEAEEVDTGKYIYLFPGDLNKRDLKELKNYNLELLGVQELEGWNGMTFKDFAVKGTKEDLERYCSEYLDYVMHPDYLYKEGEFAGDLEYYAI